MLDYFSHIVFACGVISFSYAAKIFHSNRKSSQLDVLFCLLALSSGLWGVGFGAISIQQSIQVAYVCRTIGLLGTFMYLYFALKMVIKIAPIKEKSAKFFEKFSMLGFVIYALIIGKDQAVYYKVGNGITYSLNKTIQNSFYTIFLIIIAVFIFISTCTMFRKENPRRIKCFGRYFMIVLIVMLIGMVFDTILPLLGKGAFPGSSMAQFIALVVFDMAVTAINRCEVDENNMSEYIYNSLNTPILIFNLDYKLKIVNNAAKDFFYIADYSVTAGNITIDNLFNIGSEIFDFTRKSHSVTAVSVARELTCELNISKIRDTYDDVIGYIISVTDETEHIANLNAIEKAKKDADAASKSKSTFLANISHEIRTPMNAIIGFSELALQENIPVKAKEYIEDIQSASNTLLALINEILDISKIEAGKMELVCSDYYPATMLRDIYLIIESQAKQKGIDFEMSIDPRLPCKLYGDKVRIREILINLLNNAVKYTKTGKVKLSVMVLEHNGMMLDVQFAVKDTGVGIKQEDLELIFENFSRADIKKNQSIEGTGLGLAITKGFVDLMDGELKVKSEYGKGSLFRAIIPQKVVDANPIDLRRVKLDDAGNDFKLGKLRICSAEILVVDDNEINRKVVSKGLGHYGIKIDTASGGMEAYEMCGKKNYDIVFMDQMMPEVDGVEAMHMIRERYEHYKLNTGKGKIIVLTANSVSGIRDKLIAEGFDEYIGKPINYRRMEDILKRLLPKERISYEMENTNTEETVVDMNNIEGINVLSVNDVKNE